jgi:hypothetical protein
MNEVLANRRFWQLFLRRFFLLLVVSLALLAFFYFENAIPYRPPMEWLEYILFDAAALLGASALTAWLKIVAGEHRDRG